MKEEIKQAVEEYQCSGCVSGSDITCYGNPYGGGVGCGNHLAGTIILGIGKIFLGMPKGFNRLGEKADMKPRIFESYPVDHYDQWNVPVWKYLNEDKHTIVRGICPRTNWTFIDIFLENCMDKIQCIEVSQEMQEGMD